MADRCAITWNEGKNVTVKLEKKKQKKKSMVLFTASIFIRVCDGYNNNGGCYCVMVFIIMEVGCLLMLQLVRMLARRALSPRP